MQGNSTPLGALESAGTDFTDLKDVASQAVPSEFQSELTSQTQIADSMPGGLDTFEGVQAPLLSHDDPFSGLADVLFAGPDEQLEHASNTLLTATQAFVADPSSTTELPVVFADLQLGGAVLDQLIPDVLAGGVDGLSGLDAAAGSGADAAGAAAAGAADVATSINPADLFAF